MALTTTDDLIATADELTVRLTLSAIMEEMEVRLTDGYWFTGASLRVLIPLFRRMLGDKDS